METRLWIYNNAPMNYVVSRGAVALTEVLIFINCFCIALDEALIRSH